MFSGLSGAITGAISGGINLLKLGKFAKYGLEIGEGLITGAGENVAYQMLIEDKDFNDINGYDVLLSGATGGVIAGGTPLIGKIPIVKKLSDKLGDVLSKGKNSFQDKILKNIDPKKDLKNPLKPRDYTKHGNYGEITIDVDLESKEYKRLNEHSRITDINAKTTPGIDSVFEVPKAKQPPSTVVLDAKYTDKVSDKLPNLQAAKGKNPAQLSDLWIRKNIDDAIADPVLSDNIIKGLSSGDTIRVVGKVDSSKAIKYYLVDDSGKIIKDPNTKKAIEWKP